MPTKKTTKKPAKRAKTDAAFLAFAKKKKQAKKPVKAATKKQVKKPSMAPRKVIATPVVKDVFVVAVVDASGVVTISPVPDDLLNH